MSSMSKQEVTCRCCGHRIQVREIMRTDLYERAPGQNYVYVKFRCRRCKRMGQTFVPEARWDWTLLEPKRDELSETERDRLVDAGPISESELLDFSLQLKELSDLPDLSPKPSSPDEEKPSASEAPRLNLKPDRKDDKRKEEKRKGTGSEARPEARPEDSGSG